MQEPVLFNASIKENILFGESNATDAQVRKYAEMANALQFIESNFEELTEAQQIENMQESFKEICKKKQEVNNLNPDVAKKLMELGESTKSDLVVLKLIKETVENAD